jgi:hypothetical protein
MLVHLTIIHSFIAGEYPTSPGRGAEGEGWRLRKVNRRTPNMLHAHSVESVKIVDLVKAPQNLTKALH